MLSLILPTHNRLTWLPGALESCLSQGLGEGLEVVVVDDGSQDGTADYLRAYPDPRVRMLLLPESVGLPRALNQGFEKARGDLLGWFGDDDRYLPGALPRLLAALDTHPRTDLVHANLLRVDPAGTVVGEWLGGPAQYLREMNVISLCTLFRRAVWERVGGFDPDMLLAEDYDYWVRAFKAGFRFKHLDEPLYRYQLHPDQLGERAGGAAVVARVRDRVRSRHFHPLERSAFRWLARLRRLWWRFTNPPRFLRDRQVGRTVPFPRSDGDGRERAR